MERNVKLEGLGLFCYLTLSRNKHPIEALRTMKEQGHDLTWWDTVTDKAQFCRIVRQVQQEPTAKNGINEIIISSIACFIGGLIVGLAIPVILNMSCQLPI